MDLCWYCGEEIEFRWVDGGPRPIHLSGGWCSGERADYSGGRSSLRSAPVREPVARASSRWSTGHARCDLGVSITHPTVCPLCGAIIFFHTNGNGDCVFFDDLGPPWPKHACLSSEDGVRAASRSRELMRLVDRVVAPTHIAPPAGRPIHEFDEAEIGRLVIGVVLSFKQRKAWRSSPETTIRQAVQVVVVTLQLSPKNLLRIYTPVGVHFQVGDVVQMALREETFDGRRVLFAESGSTVVPPGNDPAR
jgi:hypothetical protein